MEAPCGLKALMIPPSVENMVAPIVVFVAGKSFAKGVEHLDFSAWLNELVYGFIHGQVWLLLAIIFVICVIVCTLFDST